MKLELKNIGMIKEATVKLDGLTVIAGENDTGKSTVGKLSFSIIKAISRYKEDLEENREKQISNIIEKIYFKLRREISFSEDLSLRYLFYPPRFFEEIEFEKEKAIDKRIEFLKDVLKESSSDFYNDILQQLKNLKNIIDKNITENDMQKRAFQKMLTSEFKSSIATESSKIEVYDGDNLILDISFSKTKVKEFELFDEFYFNDSLFIESPILLQLTELIDNSITYFEMEQISSKRFRANIPLHIKDLNKKLKESVYYNDDIIEFMGNDDLEYKDILIKNLSEVIKGQIKYDKKTRDFLYIKNDKRFFSINTATGIKTFGTLQMLIKSGFINERSLLILDEPEVHLHPKWQLEYAKILVELVEHGVNILITSHSPYMIEALELYSKQASISRNFYLAQKEKNYSIIKDLTKDTSMIYELLAEPFDRLEDEEIGHIKW